MQCCKKSSHYPLLCNSRTFISQHTSCHIRLSCSIATMVSNCSTALPVPLGYQHLNLIPLSHGDHDYCNDVMNLTFTNIFNVSHSYTHCCKVQPRHSCTHTTCIYNFMCYVYTTVQTVPYISHALHKYTHLLTMVQTHCYVNITMQCHMERIKRITNSACAQSDEKGGRYD